MVARILAGSGQTPLVVDIEETSISGLQNSDRRDGPAETLCRVLCCPAVEERMQNYDDQSSELQPPARIVLGPGQGILLLPGKEKGKLEAINLNLSGYGR
jgi:hypothetical protein